MGVEASKLGVGAVSRGYTSSNYSTVNSEMVEYPNLCRNELESPAWTLLHQCTLDQWKDGHADAAGFQESRLTCSGALHKDCSRSFCTSRQGFINLSRSSFFSFRKRSKFAHMAEHFEYNHIPAQMSSINHFRVCGVLCFDDSLVVLHLSCNVTCQFGLLDLRANKFLGVFGSQSTDISNDSISGELSPDKSKCLIAMPLVVESENLQPPAQRRVILRLYDLRSKSLLSETTLDGDKCHFSFDPRFSWRRAVVTNFESGTTNSISIVSTDNWQTLCTNRHATDEGRVGAASSSMYPFLKDLQYTRGGNLIVGTLLDNVCYCREKRSMSAGPGATGNYRPVAASVYVFHGETADTLHCIQYRRYTCGIHSCPVNYRPVWSACGTRMALVMDSNSSSSSTQHYVQVYKLPSPSSLGVRSLEALCRKAILQSEYRNYITSLPLPPKMIKYLQFKPEFDS